MNTDVKAIDHRGTTTYFEAIGVIPVGQQQLKEPGFDRWFYKGNGQPAKGQPQIAFGAQVMSIWTKEQGSQITIALDGKIIQKL